MFIKIKCHSRTLRKWILYHIKSSQTNPLDRCLVRPQQKKTANQYSIFKRWEDSNRSRGFSHQQGSHPLQKNPPTVDEGAEFHFCNLGQWPLSTNVPWTHHRTPAGCQKIFPRFGHKLSYFLFGLLGGQIIIDPSLEKTEDIVLRPLTQANQLIFNVTWG